ncbi:MAG: relaxase/mobilization nuclease domain-containing protein [Oscillospiraceae bacterium]|nr:relaxase/mobilization nuclease domain-containing protein [Oscillospiraceae bacterium]
MEYVLKFIHGEYKDENALNDVHNYITKFEKCRGLNGGYNILPEHAVEMMQDIKNLYGENKGKMLIHFIVSLPIKYCVTDTGMLVCARLIASGLNSTQVVYGIHSDSDHIHAHFMVNTVTLNGERISVPLIRDEVASICYEVFNNPMVLNSILN